MKKTARKSQSRLLIAGIASLLIGITAVSQAGEKRKPIAPADTASNPVEVAVLAARVAALGEERKDPLALLVAAKLMKSVSSDASSPSSHAARWLDMAQKLAGDRADLTALIEDARFSGARGVVEGMAQQTGAVDGGKGKNYVFTFEANSPAAVGLTLQPDQDRAKADLDLYVADEKGSAICASEGPGMPELCRWTPRKTGKFQVRVQNRLESNAEFVLFVR